MSELCKQLSKYRGVVYSLSKSVPQNILIKIYHSLIYPQNINNIIIWGGTNITNRDKITVAINKILKIILKVKYDENHIPLVPTNLMYKQLAFLKFPDIHRYFLLKFVHFILYRRYDVFNEFFSHLLPLNNYSMRSSKINLPSIRKEIERHFTIYQVCNLIRELPDQFLNPMTNYSLKKNFKEYALSFY